MSVKVTAGWIGRNTPRNAQAGGRDAAIIDIAQDLLLRDLHGRGALDGLVFKGGTALRKLYAGNQGRFSTDLDFSLAGIADDPDDVVLELIAAIEAPRSVPSRTACESAGASGRYSSRAPSTRTSQTCRASSTSRPRSG